MTTPHQSAPDGSYTIGGGQFRYGQALQEDMVRNLMMAGLRNIRIGNIADAANIIEGMLRRLPLDALRMAQPFILGATDADFADVDTAVATIMRSLHIREVFATLGQVQAIIDQLISDIVRIFTGHANGLDALESWWIELSKLLGALHPDQLLGTLQKLINRLFSLLTGTIKHPDKTLKDLVGAVEDWLTNTFGALKSGVENLARGLGELIDGIWNLITGNTGVVGKTAADLVSAVGDWLSNVFGNLQSVVAALVAKIQELLDGIWLLFTGLTGVDKTVPDALKAIGDWLSGPFKTVQDVLLNVVQVVQDLIDGLSGVTGGTVTQAVDAVKGLFAKLQELIDGIVGLIGGGATTGNPVQGAVDAILGILGMSQDASNAAANANLGIEAIKAATAGGFSDEFDYPSAATLPAALYAVTYTGNASSTMGPDGRGTLVWKPGGIPGTNRNIVYRRSDAPLVGDVGTVTVVLSKPPHADASVISSVFLCGRMSATDQSCIRAVITGNRLSIQLVNGAGSAVTEGSPVTVRPAAGDTWSMAFNATDIEVFQNGVSKLKVAATGPVDAQHRYVGFGVHQPGFLWLTTHHPVPELAGWTWKPTV